jgi:SpoVK/Ycf46/Vps4 family AAA+-type ATPase
MIKIQANCGLIGILSPEEDRVQAEICNVAQAMGLDIRLWSIDSGFTIPGVRLEADDVDPDTKKPLGRVQNSMVEPDEALDAAANFGKCLVVFRDFHPFIAGDSPANIPIIRKVKEVGASLRNASAPTFIFLSGEIKLPLELQSEISLLEWELPDEKVLLSVVEGAKDSVKPDVREKLPADLDPFVQALRGLTLREAETALTCSLADVGTFEVEVLMKEKKSIVARDGLLEWIEPTMSLDDIGGLEVLKGFVLQRRLAWGKEAREFGLPFPKGILATGIAGCGKSLLAIALAVCWKIPLIRLSISRLMGGIVGETEANWRKVKAVLKAIGRCVLWIDEVEKGMAGTGGSGASDGGVSKRLLGEILTFMQENDGGIFVYATSNDVTQLPPEFLRKGRFDELFFVDLPHEAERRKIWEIHLSKRGREPSAFNVGYLSEMSGGYSGAEIEAAVVSGLFSAFDDLQSDSPSGKSESDHVEVALMKSTPLSETKKKEIEEIRKWAEGKATMASTPEERAVQPTNRFADVTKIDVN